MTKRNENQVNVEPTKELFVYIITRDIDISDAVIDLIDNCIDGAKRLRPGEGESFKGLKIDIKFDQNAFSIKDNCGGIPLEIAQKYAFRFGRAKDMPPTPGSVGQFGVGMKRALFKFGKRFSVKSKTASDSFELIVDVESWLKTKPWSFNLKTVGDGVSKGRTGTEILVNTLSPDAKRAFSNESTYNRIFSEVQTRQQFFIEKGLKIKINGTEVKKELFTIKSSAKLKPAHWEHVFEDVQEVEGLLSGPVKVKVYTGIGRSSPENAGWYIICNGRVVLDADKTTVTAWGSDLPHYHNQYSQFRGYAFFNSENAGLLPWTTTKANIDVNNIVYRRTLDKMFEMAKPVIRFLDAVDNEKELPKADRKLSKAISQAKSAVLDEEISAATFEHPDPTPIKKSDNESIRFKRPKVKVAELKDVYGVGKASEVGEEAFDEAYSRYFED